MKTNKLILIATLTALMSFSVLRAQETHQHDSSEQLGHVNFPVSCNAAAQKQFNRGMSLLHSFEYPEAEMAFSMVSGTDAKCAMAYWGKAMTYYHPLWAPPTSADLKKGAVAIEQARTVGGGTQRERDFIDALESFYKDADKLNHGVRARAYEQAMQQVYRRYPQDNEAAIFYALILNERALVAGEKEYVENKKRAAKILNSVLPKEPAHPGIIHYLIHSYDVPNLAYLALPAARSYARIAPSSAHALHMPSHIFTRLGLWQESIQSNLASAASAEEKVRKTNPGWAAQDQLHALDYLIYAYLQGAQDRKALEVLEEVTRLRQIDQEVFQAAYAWSAIPARYALERHRWNEAIMLIPRPVEFPWQRFPFAEANVYFAHAVGAARLGNAAEAREQIERLAAIQKSLSEVKIGYDWATQVDIQRQTATAWALHAEGKNDEAVQLMRAAADLEDQTEKHPVTPGVLLPAREMLGDLLFEVKQPARALTEYETALRSAPNRFNSLYGAGRAAELLGIPRKARLYYGKLVAQCGRSDRSRLKLEQARIYLKKASRK